MSTVAARVYDYGDKLRVAFAADKRMSWHNATVTKLWAFENETALFPVLGGAGVFTSIRQAATWVENGGDPDTKPEFDEKDFHLIAADSKGQLWLAADSLEWIPIEEDVASVGSGSPYAMGAMLAGATPERAIEIATQMDSATGNGITDYYFDIPKENNDG